MAGFSDFLEAKLLEHVLNNSAYTAPTAVFVALSTTASTDATAGTPPGSNYARKTVTAGGWTDKDNATRFSNNAAVTFVVATGSWSTITHMELHSLVTAGDFLAWFDMVDVAITTDDQLEFAVDKLGVTLD